ncbi:MAG: pyridoxal phosphate-dependent aminotransferase [Hyphomicrobiales bacterium]|nr:pyridoxal phosphate-dependent aminotransferase [Hyphomicrobiales bacterium]
MTIHSDTSSLASSLRPEALSAPESGIVEVMNYGRMRPGLIPLWAGEGDEPTPSFIAEAATRALAAGETFYTYQRGLPDLREALADYHQRLFGKTFSPEQFFVTGSGMQAIQVALGMTVGAGDEILIPSPAWPNAAAAAGVNGGKARFVPMTFGNTGWQLDLEKLFAARTDRTRAIFINSPSNPTGWTATADELRSILAFARQHGLWIIADEIYTRFYYAGARAPSFLDIMEEDDKILFVNTFSKNWSMTGWRMGWIMAPPRLGQVVENLIQYATSGVAAFMQRAGIVALTRGEPYVEHVIDRARRGRAIVCDGLASTGRVRFTPPDGAFYLFFSIDGERDVRQLGLRLVDEANIGMAPGTAFGPGGEGYMRFCFLRREDLVEEAVSRLVTWLKR